MQTHYAIFDAKCYRTLSSASFQNQTEKDMASNDQPTWVQKIKWDAHGLVPVIAQDYQTKQVLMFAYMNPTSLQLSVEKGEAIYYSRSRQKLWHKGEESGHIQKIHEIRLDCDGDVLLITIEQVGGIACHTGRQHCFFHQLNDQQEWVIVDPVLKDPKDIYK